MIIMIFGYYFHGLIGFVIKVFGYTGKNASFSYGISVIPITLLAGTIGLIVLNYMEKKKSKLT